MRCPKCKSYNHDKANYCIKCGASLNIELKTKSKKNYIFSLIFIVSCIIIFFLFFFSSGEMNYKSDYINSEEMKSKSNVHKETFPEKATSSFISKPNAGSKEQNMEDNSIKPDTKGDLFKQGIMLKDSDPLKSLILLLEGYDSNSMKNITGISGNQRHEKIEMIIRDNISKLCEMDRRNEVIAIFTPEILNKTESIDIFKDVLLLITEDFGYGRAIQFAVSVKHQPFFLIPQRQNSIDNIIISLYCSWLIQQLNLNDIDNAEKIYEFAVEEYPGNAAIELFGVDIALMQGDWKKAELLFEQINIPESLLNRANIIKNKISELKGIDGKTVIRFEPGTKHIPLTAVLNSRLKQKFLLDTGASFVTVPSSTVRALKIKIGSDVPTRNVATAGGVKKAKEIVIDSIKLGNCVVNNIKILVLDIPGQPDLGLLGLNFLQLFHVEMDNEKGILILKPK